MGAKPNCIMVLNNFNSYFVGNLEGKILIKSNKKLLNIIPVFNQSLCKQTKHKTKTNKWKFFGWW